MACFHPVQAYLSSSGHVSFTELARDNIVKSLKLPCQQCIGCRLDRARDWSLRIGHESKSHAISHFVTMTYDDAHLPMHGSLNYSDVQLFHKRLRKAFGPFRFFVVGEYGDTSDRPHYHGIYFSLAVPDLKRFGGSDKMPTYASERVNQIWGKGFCLFGSLTPQSASYVCRYALKKVNGQRAETHYQRVTPDGEIVTIEREFARMSTKPGIGHTWFMKYHSDVTTHDYVIQDGAKNPVPPYYDKLFKRIGGELDVTKMGRMEKALLRAADNTPERLAAREIVAKARASTKARE